MIFLDKHTDKSYASKNMGGKAYNLYILESCGINVPKWKVLGAKIFESIKENKNLNSKIETLLDNHNNLENISFEIMKVIEDITLTDEELTPLKELFDSFKGSTLAIRSSALDEDGGSHSFAGQLSSFLYVRDFNNFILSIKKCWASAYEYRGLSYRLENNLDLNNIKVAVVVQEMIDPDKSGVAFSANPVNESFDEVVINSVFGVGEGLVSGAIDADTFTISKSDFSIISKDIVKKDIMFIQDIENQCPKEHPVDNQIQDSSSLSDQELTDITKVSKKIEAIYHYPQDIEWAIKDKKIYILQARPITSKVINNIGHLYIWDNSNIVESYGGITKPLTFGFAHYVYHQVYVQFCEILMVPTKHIRSMDKYLKNMLGHIRGRVYYNLLNWYKLTSILPGYKYNRSFMETMMGTDKALEDEIAKRTLPPSFQKGLGATFRKILTGAKFFYFHLNIQNVVDNFLNHFNKNYENFKKIDYSTLSSDQIYLEYQKLEECMLWKWHAPIINDFLCMVHFGIFKKLTDKWFSSFDKNFHNDLLAGNGNLESAMPTKELIRIAGLVKSTKGLEEFVFATENDDLIEALRQSNYQSFYQEVLDYKDKYGFRCMSEMKLEEKDLYQRPSLFFIFLKNILNSNVTNLEEYEKREKEIREGAEKKVQEHIDGLKKKVYLWSLKHARKAVMNRENTRFCRTRVYGIVRRMFFAIGADYVKRGIINAQEDIFYLTLHELKGSLEGTVSSISFKEIIELRKKEFQEYEDENPPLPRFLTRGPVYWQSDIFEKEIELDDSDLEENQLKGLGCCPGVIQGVCKVINGPEDDLTLNGEILVTTRTDPGWIPLYPSISALLVERGGLLSHSAIVAREMGLPTIVSIKGLTKKIKSGMVLRIDGKSGLIEIIEE